MYNNTADYGSVNGGNHSATLYSSPNRRRVRRVKSKEEQQQNIPRERSHIERERKRDASEKGRKTERNSGRKGQNETVKENKA